MKKVLCLITFIVVSFTITFAQTPSQAKPAQNPKVVTAAQVNGVYRFYKSEFSVLALGHNKLKVQFDGVYVTLMKSVNTGDAIGEATIEGNVAMFIPPDTERCKITLTFLPGKLVAKQ